MHRVQARIRRVCPFFLMVTLWRLGKKRRRVLLLAWLTLLPITGSFPHSSQTYAMILLLIGKFRIRQNRRLIIIRLRQNPRHPMISMRNYFPGSTTIFQSISIAGFIHRNAIRRITGYFSATRNNTSLLDFSSTAISHNEASYSMDRLAFSP